MEAILNRSDENRLRAFALDRSYLVALAYRMLGDVGRAEDMVQEAWLRWQAAAVEVESPRAYLVTVVTRLCLQELDSARSRKEESRGDRLPEPVDLEASGLCSAERIERVSMAFGVALQRLTPAERAVLLLHDVFDLEHQEIARLLEKSVPACRKLLERARHDVRDARRMLETSADEHRRLLQAFVSAAGAGDMTSLVALLAEDAVIISDGGSEGRGVGGLRNLRKPLAGAARVAAFVVAATRRGGALFQVEEHELNGQPAVVFYDGERPSAALLLGVADGKIQRVFFHADLQRLAHLGPRPALELPGLGSTRP
ncbi:MAG TPA: sigma-70 family RNA polymerase sigma factor [Polyangiaceae bacterium]|nr:sigma-70 family RNA polymerase sigma factor [Polyangiaceae bacterium]